MSQQQQQQHHQDQVQASFNGGGAGAPANVRHQTNKPMRGLPAVLPDPGVQPGTNPLMNNPYGQQANTVTHGQTAPAPASTASHFSFFGHTIGNNQPNSQPQQQPAGPSLIQKMMGGVGQQATQQPGAPSATENPVEGLLSKGKDLLFKKFGL